MGGERNPLLAQSNADKKLDELEKFLESNATLNHARGIESFSEWLNPVNFFKNGSDFFINDIKKITNKAKEIIADLGGKIEEQRITGVSDYNNLARLSSMMSEYINYIKIVIHVKYKNTVQDFYDLSMTLQKSSSHQIMPN